MCDVRLNTESIGYRETSIMRKLHDLQKKKYTTEGKTTKLELATNRFAPILTENYRSDSTA
jgi:hypothetical protein